MTFADIIKQIEKIKPPQFQDLINRQEKVGTPRKITVGGTPTMNIGDSPKIRIGVYLADFDNLVSRLEKV